MKLLYIGSGEDFPPKPIIQSCQQIPKHGETSVSRNRTTFWQNRFNRYKQVLPNTPGPEEMGYEAGNPIQTISSC